MFTGIIDQVGVVGSVKKTGNKKIFCVKLSKNFKDISLGESIAVNGVCQTVSRLQGSKVFFYAMNRTLALSNINNLRSDDKVNIEFSLKPESRISGHFVLGHVDCLGEIIKIDKKSDASFFEIKFPEEFSRLLVKRGSIAVNGISLTVADIKNSVFSFYAIPQTLQNTTLRYAKKLDMVNLEIDILAKYTLTHEASPRELLPSQSGITPDFLRKKGFLK